LLEGWITLSTAQIAIQWMNVNKTNHAIRWLVIYLLEQLGPVLLQQQGINEQKNKNMLLTKTNKETQQLLTLH